MFEGALQPGPSFEALLAYLKATPGASPQAIAEHFGRDRGWFLAVLASDAFQAALDPVRGEIDNPLVTATLEERFRGLVLKGMSVLQKKLDNPEVQDFTVLKAVEIGVKGIATLTPKLSDPDLPTAHSVDKLALRLTEALERARQPRVLDAEAVRVDHGG